MIIKTCGCGRAFTAAAWARLPYVGIMAGCLEMRNCLCGSTIAVKHGRRYVGIELNPEYVEMSRKRIANG